MVKKIEKVNKAMVKKQAEALIPTPWGNFNMIAFAADESEWMPHLALVHEDCDITKPVLTRIHSECITGDLFGSRRCDCGEQLDKSMQMAAEQGGLVLYLRQEGRGIGIINKLKAYNLQDLGLNTVDADIDHGGAGLHPTAPDEPRPADGGDASEATALGVLRAIERSVSRHLDGAALDGLTVGVQGLGHVGRRLCDLLAERGAWEEVEPGRYATTCVGDAECVFVVYERGVALCAIQRARQAGQLEVEKPVSCALFPIRVRDLGELWALNLEPIAECAPGHAQGEAEGLNVVEFLQGPLTRRFGEAFTAALLAEIRRQQAALRG